jgi:tRNA(adenine34) deaminase
MNPKSEIRNRKWAPLMRTALEQARLAPAVDEVPIGAVLAGPDGEILAAAHNRRHVDADPTAHAEMLVLRAAARRLGDWRLTGCTLAVTLEPCAMCAGAMVLARVARLVYGAADPKAGAVESLHQLCTDPRLNHRVEIVSGVLAGECGQLLSDFFQTQRAKGKK